MLRTAAFSRNRRKILSDKALRCLSAIVGCKKTRNPLLAPLLLGLVLVFNFQMIFAVSCFSGSSNTEMRRQANQTKNCSFLIEFLPNSCYSLNCWTELPVLLNQIASTRERLSSDKMNSSRIHYLIFWK